MDFPKEELLEKYVNIYEEYIADYVPDFEVKDGTTRYVRFNDAWRGLNPNIIEYTFERVPDGLEYTSNYYFRRSQTLTDKGHISEDTLTHLAENGIRLV